MDLKPSVLSPKRLLSWLFYVAILRWEEVELLQFGVSDQIDVFSTAF
jgi:hypothetical protein